VKDFLSMPLSGLQTFRRILLDRNFVLGLFAVFILLRIAVLLFVPVSPTSDAAWYVDRARELARGEGYHEGRWPTAFWPIGYPAFLGLVFSLAGPHLIAAQLANLALSCGIFLLTYRIAQDVFSDEITSRVAIFLLTIYPNQIAYTGILLSEMLLTFLLLLAIHIFTIRPNNLGSFFAAILFGFGALVKAQMVLLPVILLLLYGWHIWGEKGHLKRVTTLATIFATGMGLVILPWTARNYIVFDALILISTNGGTTLLTGNNPEARGDFTPQNSLSPLARFSVVDQVAADERAFTLAVDWIRDNPVRFLELIPMKVWRLWAPDGEGEWAYQAGYAGYDTRAFWFRAIRILNQVLYTGAIIASVVAFVMLLPPDRRYPWIYLGIMIALYTTTISAVFSGQSRFHFPVMPWIFIYVGWVVSQRIVTR
jgi:hypothetical protein